MSTQAIYSRPSFPAVTLAWAACGGALLTVAAIRGNPHLALAAGFPLAVALGLAVTRPRPFRAEATSTGIKGPGRDDEIPYAQVEALLIGGAARDPEDAHLRPGPLIIASKQETLEIPARLNVSPVELYRQLLERIPQTGSRQVHAKLAAYVSEQEETFGADRVFTFVGRRDLGLGRASRRVKTCLALLLATGVAWIAVPCVVALGRDERGSWIALGVFLSIISLVALLVATQGRTPGLRRLRRHHDPSLAVTPKGIAMMQGDLSGQMRWDEIREIRLGKRPRQFSLQHQALPSEGLHLVVEGAQVQVADVYDRPLATIYAVMRRYWRPG